MKDHIAEVEKFRSKSNIMEKMYEGTATASKKINFGQMLRYIFIKFLEAIKTESYKLKNGKNYLYYFYKPFRSNPIKRFF